MFTCFFLKNARGKHFVAGILHFSNYRNSRPKKIVFKRLRLSEKYFPHGTDGANRALPAPVSGFYSIVSFLVDGSSGFFEGSVSVRTPLSNFAVIFSESIPEMSNER